MLRLVVALILLALLHAYSPVSAQDDVSCADFDAWEWAQAVFEANPVMYAALDPDSDGMVCPDLPHGFAPAFWTEAIPQDVEAAEIIQMVDRDTLEVEIDGDVTEIHLYPAKSPETENKAHCGEQEATDFATWALSFSAHPVMYLERDDNIPLDQDGREIIYVWFEIDGNPYMLNHVLISTGWNAGVVDGARTYDTHLKDAAAFADRHDLGVWNLCEGVGTPVPAPVLPSTWDPTAPQRTPPTWDPTAPQGKDRWLPDERFVMIAVNGQD